MSIIVLLLVIEEHDEETFEGTTGLPSQFSCFVEKLPTCMSKQMVDEVCIYTVIPIYTGLLSCCPMNITMQYSYLIVVTDGY